MADGGDRIKTPLLVLQAGDDSVVDNAAQDAFCANACCEEGKPLRIEGAWHELFHRGGSPAPGRAQRNLPWQCLLHATSGWLFLYP